MLEDIASSTLGATGTHTTSSGRIAARSGGQIAFDTYGEGPPLVLVHGAFSDHQTNWTYVKTLLVPHFRVYAIARRGRGATDAATDRALEDEFEDVAALIRLIGEPVFLLGHSYGAHVVLGTAVAVPDLVRKLIVYEPAWPQLLDAAAMAKLGQLADSDDWDAFAMTFFGELLQVSQVELEALKKSDDWPPIVEDAAASYADIRALAGYDFDIEQFKDLPIPVLLQTGGESLSELWATDALAAILPDQKVSVLRGAAHEAMTTDPEQYVEDVRRFLKG